MNGSKGMDGRKEKGKKRRDAISLKHVPRDLGHLPKGTPTHASNVNRYPHAFIDIYQRARGTQGEIHSSLTVNRHQEPWTAVEGGGTVGVHRRSELEMEVWFTTLISRFKNVYQADQYTDI